MTRERDPRTGRFYKLGEGPQSSSALETSFDPGQALIEARQQIDSMEVMLEERLAELELQLEDTGWIRQAAYTDRDFTRDGLRRIIRQARLYFLKNPLINHGVRLQADYVFGQGVEIQARSAAVNDLVQAHMDDAGNARVLYGHQARKLLEQQLQVEGNLFFALFTNPSTGWVQVRQIHCDEVSEVVKNPEDASEPWYYHRIWEQRAGDPASGTITTSKQEAYYPALNYWPAERPATFGRFPIIWDAPVFHVKVGHLSDMTFGVPEVYSALDWAQAVKANLEDHATITRALASFAWKLNAKGGPRGVTAGKAKLSTTLGQGPGYASEMNPPATKGATFIESAAASLEPIKTAGTTTNPEDSRRLWLMASAALGIPVTMLTGDAEAGSYATAATLDRPTELKMRDRQTLWADIFSALLGYVIQQSALATSGVLPGKQKKHPISGNTIVVLGKDPDSEEGDPMDSGIEVRFPSVLERDVLKRVQAAVTAATLSQTGTGVSAGYIDDRTITAELLSALGVAEIDEKLDLLYPDNATMLGAGPGNIPPLEAEQTEALRELREALVAMGEPRGVYPHHGHRGIKGHRALQRHLRTHHKGVRRTGTHKHLQAVHAGSHTRLQASGELGHEHEAGSPDWLPQDLLEEGRIPLEVLEDDDDPDPDPEAPMRTEIEYDDLNRITSVTERPA